MRKELISYFIKRLLGIYTLWLALHLTLLLVYKKHYRINEEKIFYPFNREGIDLFNIQYYGITEFLFYALIPLLVGIAIYLLFSNKHQRPFQIPQKIKKIITIATFILLSVSIYLIANKIYSFRSEIDEINNVVNELTLELQESDSLHNKEIESGGNRYRGISEGGKIKSQISANNQKLVNTKTTLNNLYIFELILISLFLLLLIYGLRKWKNR